MKTIKFLLTCLFLISSCKSNDAVDNSVQVSIPTVESTTPVEPVSACKILTESDLKKVFPNKVFFTETDRNDPPNIYEALSTCSYKEKDRTIMEVFGVDLEVRAKLTQEEALRLINSNIEMDYDKRGRPLEEIADKAYFYNSSMAYGGPTLEFVNKNVYYKIKIMVFKADALKLSEHQLTELAKIILEKNNRAY